MTVILHSILLMLVLWLGSYAAYLLFNHGLAPNARLQQLLRYLVAALVAVVPLCVTATPVCQPAVMAFLAVSFLWTVTFPLCYHLTHRKSSPDYDHQIDGAFGIYLFGWLSGLAMLPYSQYFLGIILLALVFLPFAQWVYFIMYRNVIDISGMQLIQDTDYNEIVEFIRSYSLPRTLLVAAALLLAVVGCILLPVYWPLTGATTSWWQLAIVVAIVIFITVYAFKPRHGLFVRTGIVDLYQTVRDYQADNSQYTAQQRQRLAMLDAEPLSTLSQPHTMLLVIGESASRDFMSAFTPMNDKTTPWLEALAGDTRHCVLFPNAYSCDIQTVPTLEKALTEMNQYSGGAFFSSCSIVDMAHKLGYRVHWYSNQGHLGVADTPITLVAETADVAKWTCQQFNHVQYDESLVDFLAELDPTVNNLVVLHLMGSHFNYENRFTEALRQWGSADNHDQQTNYKNSLYYTDQAVLKRAFDYGRAHLNLQTMVYFSDHADVPDRHRQPNFGGFRDTRIPLMVWCGDDYLQRRPARAEALRRNSDRHWTNDLLYELMCGLMDVRSSHFCEARSLASPDYNMAREDLKAMSGRINIADDIKRD